MLSQEDVKRLFSYCPETGLFTRLVSNNKRRKVGEIVGTIHITGYVIIKINKVAYPAHRLAFLYMTGSFPTDMTDHIDGIRDNNRWINLREATRSENNRNSKIRSDNKSGFKGVFFEKSANKWRALCWANGVQNHLGLFNTAIEASNSYQDFAKNNHAEFYKIAA